MRLLRCDSEGIFLRFVNPESCLDPHGLSFESFGLFWIFAEAFKFGHKPRPPRIGSPLPRSSALLTCADVLSNRHVVTYMFNACFPLVVFNDHPGPPPHWFQGQSMPRRPHTASLWWKLFLITICIDCCCCCHHCCVPYFWYGSDTVPTHKPQTPPSLGHMTAALSPHPLSAEAVFLFICFATSISYISYWLTDCNKSLCDLKDLKQFLSGEVENIYHLRKKKNTE